MTRAQNTALSQVLVADFINSGGKIKVLKPGTPKDLKRLKRSGWLFGGRRTYNATLLNRSQSSESNLFDGGAVIKPNSFKKGA